MNNTTVAKSKYKYTPLVRKLILNQFGAAMLGIMTSLPTLSLASGSLLNMLTTALAILFYVYIIYTATWDIGAKDKIAIDGNRMAKDKFIGLKAALIASIPTYVLTVISIIFKGVFLMTNVRGIGLVSDISYGAVLLWNYMYHGILSAIVPESKTSIASLLYLAVFFLLTAPAILVCFFSYLQGISGKRILPEKKNN